MKVLLLTLFLFLIAACATDPKSVQLKNHLSLPEAGFSFKLVQRSQIEIPSDSSTFFCHIDDITKGQTMLKLTEKGHIVLLKSVREGMQTEFEFNGKYYLLICDKLLNKGLGQDYGYFQVLRDEGNSREMVDESSAIEALIRKVAQSDIAFIRNGEEHTGKEAADHLKKKIHSHADGEYEVKTVESFITNLASKSSVSGKAYQVKMKNGKVITAESWFRSLLKERK